MKPGAVPFSIILALALLAAPVPSPGQQPARVYRIGFLWGGGVVPTDQTAQHCPAKGGPRWQAFVEGLREHGYVPGQNVVIECRYAEGRQERAPALVAELMRLKPDLIVAAAPIGALAAKQATSTIPIVFVSVIDPVGRGLVASLAHPGGNITGVTYTTGVGIAGKLLQLLKEVVPTASRVAVLKYPTSVPAFAYDQEEEAAAQALHVTLLRFSVQAPEELAGAFAAMTAARADALLVNAYPFFMANLQRIVELAAQHRLPAMYPDRDYVKAGGLMSYGVHEPAIFGRLAFYVDKIFKGVNPGDLPVEQPTKFELIINLKTAQALGLTIPQSLLSRADEVIE